LAGLSLSECKANCLSSTTCVGFDFDAAQGNDCYLKSGCAGMSGVSANAGCPNGWCYYHKQKDNTGGFEELGGQCGDYYTVSAGSAGGSADSSASLQLCKSQYARSIAAIQLPHCASLQYASLASNSFELHPRQVRRAQRLRRIRLGPPRDLRH
jgi:hypothetical protein